MRYRLLAPVGVAGAIALGAWVPTVTSAAAATPSLPSLSAQQLIAKAQSANVKGFSGTVRWTANLGLPSLSALTSGVGGQGGGHAFDPTSLLSGNHDISVWDAGPSQQRLALPGSLSEVDVIHNGSNLYYFDSATQKVTDYTGLKGSSGREAPSQATGTELTPDQAAQKLLSALSPSTGVSVVTPVYVARQAAYQLVLTPKAAQSTVGSVDIAIDAANGMPLRVQVIPRASNAPALSLGFTRISFSVPSAGNFAAPHGSSTVTKPIGRAFDASGPLAGPGGRVRRGHLHGTGPATQTAPAGTAGGESTPMPSGTAPSGGHPTTIGTDWATIGVLNSAGPRVAGELTKVGTAVTGSFGTGHLVTSSLLNALVLPDGKVLAGFVTPAALEAAAANAG
ncbi:hypothetical protein K6U06_21490 [Acidiferrimicrobium sp. IK]|uniref:hypothetical protein n=1 Tax=Acidiferrimicrobium sp. IK TaxID=2871700 RepID=UPI0021CAEE04|nr:hypothetical protein [Acidiferrimicrobium sp. IK]MCU4186954.1 hypothetical protein [Acidiferrimicrobium sp. IK]